MGLMSRYGVSSSGGGGPPPSPVITLIVNNSTELQALDDTLYVNGARVRVMTYLDDFDLLQDCDEPVTPHLIFPTTSGLGRWVRRLQGNTEAWLAESVWHIDAVAGNDEATGRDGEPLQTWAELMRRWSGATYKSFHTVSKTVRVTGSLPADDPMDFDFSTDQDTLIVISADLPAPAFSGVISAKTDLSFVAPGVSTKAVSTWTGALVGTHLIRDVTNNRWAWAALDLGGGQLKLSPWTNIDTALGSITVTLGNTTVGAEVEAYALARINALSNMTVSNIRTGSLVNVVVQNFEIPACVFRGPKFVLQNCRIQACRWADGILPANNCCHENSGPFSLTTQGGLLLNSGLVRTSIGDQANTVGCIIDARSGVLFQAAQCLINRGGLFRMREFFSEDSGVGANFRLLQGSQAFATSASMICGVGNTGVNWDIRDCSSVVIAGGTAVGVCRLVSGATAIWLNQLTAANAFDPATGLYTAPRNLTYANIDAAVGVGGFGLAVMEPRTGGQFIINPP